jgi:hypothetical protein
MPSHKIETRLAMLEAEVERLRARLEAGSTAVTPWWDRIAGTFADDLAHEQAMKMGRMYRDSLRPGKPKARKR